MIPSMVLTIQKILFDLLGKNSVKNNFNFAEGRKNSRSIYSLDKKDSYKNDECDDDAILEKNIWFAEEEVFPAIVFKHQ